MSQAEHTDYSEALERGLAVLRYFGHSRTTATQADIANALSIPRATARRAIFTLLELGYLSVEGRHYTLTPKVLEFLGGFLDSNPSMAVLQALCDRLSAKWQSTCGVSLPDGEDAVMIARAVPNQPALLGSGVGLRIPLRTSAAGKVLLAYSVSGFSTPGQHADEAPMTKEELDSTRRAGYAYVSNEVQAGFHSVAVPVLRRDGTAVASVHLGTSVGHHSPAQMCGAIARDLTTEVAAIRNEIM